MPHRATSSPAGDSRWGSRMKVAGWANRGDAKPSRCFGCSFDASMAVAADERRLELAAQGGHRLRQALDVLGGVVHREACAQRAHDTEALHERLGTVMSGPHRDAALVEERGPVVRMEALDVERHHRALHLRIT